MHFVRRSWKISYTGRLSRLGSPPLSPSPPPSPPPFGLGIREEGKSQAFRVFSKGSFVASPRDPYRIFLKEKIPLCSRTADRGGGRERERGDKRPPKRGRNFRFALYCLFINVACIVVRLFNVSSHSATRNYAEQQFIVERLLRSPLVYIYPFLYRNSFVFFFSFSFFFFFFFLPLPLPRTFCRVLTARFLSFFF